MDTDAPKTRKVKKQVRKGDLPIVAATASLDQAIKDRYFEFEGQMQSEDKLVAETEEKKNELETEIYSLRNKVDEPYESNGYADFASESEKETVKAKCEQLEVSQLFRCVDDTDCHRIGCTTRAMMLARHSILPKSTNCALQPDRSFSASTTSDRKKKMHEERSSRRKLPNDGLMKKPGRKLRSERPRRLRMRSLMR